MTIERWTDAQAQAFLSDLMDEIRECCQARCDEEPEYAYFDGFGHTHLYCQSHAITHLTLFQSRRERNQWRRIRPCH